MFKSSVICIGGLLGIGSVGKVAADYLATALECSTAKQFFSKGFPAQVVIMGIQPAFYILRTYALAGNSYNYAKNMYLVYQHWSGKRHRIVNGINITTLNTGLLIC